MLSPALFKEKPDTVNIKYWDRERTAKLTRRYVSRLHTRTKGSVDAN